MTPTIWHETKRTRKMMTIKNLPAINDYPYNYGTKVYLQTSDNAAVINMRKSRVFTLDRSRPSPADSSGLANVCWQNENCSRFMEITIKPVIIRSRMRRQENMLFVLLLNSTFSFRISHCGLRLVQLVPLCLLYTSHFILVCFCSLFSSLINIVYAQH